jgi:ADP-ribose pyrophosphatase YjhB (NUDIX family)
MPSARFAAPLTAHVFLLDGENVLLLRRHNTGYEDGNFSVVAGHLDGGEEVVAAAIREAREEAGIALAPGDLVVVGVMHRRQGDERVDFFLAARRWSGTPVNREPDKCDMLAWYPTDALPANTIPYVRRALENYRRGVWFDSFGWTAQ